MANFLNQEVITQETGATSLLLSISANCNRALMCYNCIGGLAMVVLRSTKQLLSQT